MHRYSHIELPPYRGPIEINVSSDYPMRTIGHHESMFIAVLLAVHGCGSKIP